MITTLRDRFMRWWRPFWYGFPCPHGNYGRRWNDKPFLLLCGECRREFDRRWHETHCVKCGLPRQEREGSGSVTHYQRESDK